MISEQKSNFQTVVTSLNQHLLSRVPGVRLSQRQQESEIEKSISHMSLKWYRALLEGHVGKSRQRAGRESTAGPRAHVFIIRVGGWSAFGFLD